MKYSLAGLISILVLLITIFSIAQWTNLPVGETFVWWFIDICTLAAFIMARQEYFDQRDNNKLLILKIYLAWNIICILRGLFVAENYWEWKNLIGVGLVLLLPISIYAFTNKTVVQHILTTWLKFALPAFILFLPFMEGEAVGRYFVPFSFLLLFFPLLDKKWKLLCLAVFFLVFISDLGARSNIIKFSIPFLLGLLFYVRAFIPNRIIAFIRVLLLILPFIFFTLGITGAFNIFKIKEYTSGNLVTTSVLKGEKVEEDLTKDTRTFLYKEVLISAIKYDYVLFGRTPARGNESEWFGEFSKYVLKTGKMERFANEVSILNIFTWTGVVGVALYFLIFWHASYLAIHKSNNFYVKIVGLYVAFRWTYAWVEDFSRFDLSYLFLWIMIGMCYSKAFREMNNFIIKYWLKGIFSKKYRVELIKYQLLMMK
ncbi:hypothetical protein [Pontibacter cellulosilyticus]|uniref:O-antigen ligase domain-containing protein n=1 Tax=Pontibacter cellulosilyticus TaxID=1720253 RepID=A0A923N6B7_9BACT|nr:hypothetical protein [Pontibacter cellulosilyticus]MBC5992532.1 hypothetical protein [Pontibacter cellulosilyticus]